MRIKELVRAVKKQWKAVMAYASYSANQLFFYWTGYCGCSIYPVLYEERKHQILAACTPGACGHKRQEHDS